MQSSVSMKYPNDFALLSSMGPSIGMLSNHGLGGKLKGYPGKSTAFDKLGRLVSTQNG